MGGSEPERRGGLDGPIPLFDHEARPASFFRPARANHCLNLRKLVTRGVSEGRQKSLACAAGFLH